MAQPDRLLIGTFRDGTQVLVTEWTTAEGVPVATVARRDYSGDTWGPPVDLKEAP